jgi:hypothetical protein
MRFHKKSRPYLETDLRPVSVEAGLGDRTSMPSGRSVPALNPWKSRGPHSITFSDNSRKASVGRALGDGETCYDNKPGAGVTQLVEYLLPKQKVTGSSPVSRSMLFQTALCLVRRTALGRFRFLRDVMLYGSSGTDLRRGKSEKGRAKREERQGIVEQGASTPKLSNKFGTPAKSPPEGPAGLEGSGVTYVAGQKYPVDSARSIG